MAAADLTVGAGFDTGTQGAILSVGTNDNLIDRTRIGGKDVSAKGEADCQAVLSRSTSNASMNDKHVHTPIRRQLPRVLQDDCGIGIVLTAAQQCV